MLPQHEEEIFADKLYRKYGVSSFKDRFEQKFLLLQGGLIEETFLNHELSPVSDQLVLPMCFLHSSGGVRIVSNNLRRILPEVSNLGLKGHPLVCVLNFLKIDAMLISQWVEDVHALHCLLSPLFVAVD